MVRRRGARGGGGAHQALSLDLERTRACTPPPHARAPHPPRPTRSTPTPTPQIRCLMRVVRCGVGPREGGRWQAGSEVAGGAMKKKKPRAFSLTFFHCLCPLSPSPSTTSPTCAACSRTSASSRRRWPTWMVSVGMGRARAARPALSLSLTSPSFFVSLAPPPPPSPTRHQGLHAHPRHHRVRLPGPVGGPGRGGRPVQGLPGVHAVWHRRHARPEPADRGAGERKKRGRGGGGRAGRGRRPVSLDLPPLSPLQTRPTPTSSRTPKTPP